MSLLEDARKLATVEPRNDHSDNNGELIASVCLHCFTQADDYLEREPPHKPGCPWLSMPRIVTALAAAERIVKELPAYHHMTGGGQTRRCRYCSYRVWQDGAYEGARSHDADCPLRMLVAALVDDA